METTSTLKLLLLPLPSNFCPSDSSKIFCSVNPSPFFHFPSFLSCCCSSTSTSFSRQRRIGLLRTFHTLSNLSSRHTWLSRYAKRDESVDGARNEIELQMFGSDEEVVTQIPTQAQSLVKGSGDVLVSEFKPAPDVDYLQELLAIQQQGPRNIGFLGPGIWVSCIRSLLRFLATHWL